MNRIDQLFNTKKERILNVYFTAGYPKLDDTATVIKVLETSGADIVEIGMPFSDPVADGLTIQESNAIALNNGMSLKLLFAQLTDIRESVEIPIILMGYINPVLQFGIEEFCKACQMVGVDGLILPDLPLAEYLSTYKSIFDKHGLFNIQLITPQTSATRIKEIDGASNGFIYMVSSSSTTGAKSTISGNQQEYFERVNAMGLRNPKLIGFGISNAETFNKACENANGAIIGSAFIKAISSSRDLKGDIDSFVKKIIN